MLCHDTARLRNSVRQNSVKNGRLTPPGGGGVLVPLQIGRAVVEKVNLQKKNGAKRFVLRTLTQLFFFKIYFFFFSSLFFPAAVGRRRRDAPPPPPSSSASSSPFFLSFFVFFIQKKKQKNQETKISGTASIHRSFCDKIDGYRVLG